MKTTTKNTGIKVTTGVKGGSLGTLNHNGSALKVRAGLKAGMTIQSTNHNRMGNRIEDDQGRRYWVYRSGILGDGRGGVPEWFLQGLCG